MKRLLPLLTIAAVWFSIAGVSASPARAAALTACTPHHGTIVAVDFAHWHGPTVRGCAVNPRTGLSLLYDAGFNSAGDAQDGGSFVCRLGIDSFGHGKLYPSPSEDRCVVTPPQSAYWSYWLADPGQNHWTYSQPGPSADKPQPGEVELWMFGSTNSNHTKGTGVPQVSPGKLRASIEQPKLRTPTVTQTVTVTDTTTITATQTVTATQTETETVTAPRPAPKPVSTHTATTAAYTAPIIGANSGGAGGQKSSGPSLGLIIGLIAALAVAGGGGWAVWRRFS